VCCDRISKLQLASLARAVMLDLAVCKLQGSDQTSKPQHSVVIWSCFRPRQHSLHAILFT